MEKDSLGTYLNDHLAGSVMAIELLERLAENSTSDLERRRQMIELRQEIEADQALLKDLVETHATGQSTVKQAGAWLMEKLSRGKLRLAEAESPSLGEFEALEVLSLGIEGKKCLWKVLAEIMPGHLSSGQGWPELMRSADTQRTKVEAWRIEAGRNAFLTPSQGDAAPVSE